MAKTTKQKDAADMIEVFADFKEKNNIDRATLVSVLEECFRSVISKMYGSDENYDTKLIFLNQTRKQLIVSRCLV